MEKVRIACNPDGTIVTNFLFCQRCHKPTWHFYIKRDEPSRAYKTHVVCSNCMRITSFLLEDIEEQFDWTSEEVALIG